MTAALTTSCPTLASPRVVAGNLLVAAIAGTIYPLAFEPFNLAWLSLVSTALLYLTLQNMTRYRQAALQGSLFGVFLFSAGMYWVAVPMHRYGGANWLTTVALTAIFIMAMTLFFTAFALLFCTFMKKNWRPRWLVFALVWTLFEWLRSTLFTGLPWLLLAYPQIHTPLGGYLPVIGVFGTSFIAALLASCCSTLLKNSLGSLTTANFTHCVKFFAATLDPAAKPRDDGRGGPRLASLVRNESNSAIFWIFCSSIIVAILLLGAWLSSISFTKKIPDPLKIALVQGNIPQDDKWQDQYAPQIVQKYRTLTQPYLSANLVVWPEAAVTLPFQQAKAPLREMHQALKSHHTTLFLGIPIQASGSHYYNAMIALGENQGRYYKRHLLPFGDYLPFESQLRGTLDFFNLPMSSFIPGPLSQTLLRVKGHPIATMICYEIAFSDLVLHALPEAQILLTISNDTWFGHSIGPFQHFQIAQVEAKIAGRYLMRVTNNGITAIIDSHGKIVQRLEQFEAGVLSFEVWPMQGSTPIVWLGNNWVIISLLSLLILCGSRRKKKIFV